MKSKSAKAKGRHACQIVEKLLHQHAPELEPADILVTPSGVRGVDLYLSPAAQIKFPFVIEVKNQEALNVWAALDQAQSHLRDEMDDRTPLLFFRRNKSRLYVALEAEAFLKLLP